MIVRFEKCELKIDEFQKEGILGKNFVPHEKVVVGLITKWLNKVSQFNFYTSGSTGSPKLIQLDRTKIEYSIEATMSKLDPTHSFTSSLLCINPEMIGGAMVIFRALERNLDLTVVAPSRHPFDKRIDSQEFDLTSMVPLQFQNASYDSLSRFKCILVGGAPMPISSAISGTRIFSTFGMTETVSHVALRSIDDEIYECVGDTQVSVDDQGCLIVNGTLTNNNHLKTNDLASIETSTSFKWLGRADHIINSGGIKVSPEQIEDMLRTQISHKFIVSHLDDKEYGKKIVLILEGDHFDHHLDFSMLEKYHRPKEVHFIPQFEETSSQKINRARTQQKLVESLNKK